MTHHFSSLKVRFRGPQETVNEQHFCALSESVAIIIDYLRNRGSLLAIEDVKIWDCHSLDLHLKEPLIKTLDERTSSTYPQL